MHKHPTSFANSVSSYHPSLSYIPGRNANKRTARAAVKNACPKSKAAPPGCRLSWAKEKKCDQSSSCIDSAPLASQGTKPRLVNTIGSHLVKPSPIHGGQAPRHDQHATRSAKPKSVIGARLPLAKPLLIIGARVPRQTQ